MLVQSVVDQALTSEAELRAPGTTPHPKLKPALFIEGGPFLCTESVQAAALSPCPSELGTHGAVDLPRSAAGLQNAAEKCSIHK